MFLKLKNYADTSQIDFILKVKQKFETSLAKIENIVKK